jgi:dolichyl-phosphate beta-glucosyltransferase
VYLSVIIPAYNEEKRITKTLKAVGDFLSKENYEHEVIVVSDGSKDKTVQVVEDSKAIMTNLRVIANRDNHGKGYVVKQGMLEAKGDVRLFMDADNATPIDYIKDAEVWLGDGYDVVIASLTEPGAKVVGHEMWYRRFLGMIANIITQILATPGISDTQRGFKVFTSRAAEDIFSLTVIDRWGFDIEALALAQKFRYKIKSIPITWNNDPNSKVNIWAYPKTFIDAANIRWNLWTGRYNKKNKNA